ncbi:hypothetical protein AWB79_07416 [Caballeronia hypogeia]|uniref:Uncharacterized protein n=1 Tax=Caballeronia hypogeia TaxID=1777140 RepID=A0A158DR78_9BURK|nr:hypothetical protein AWB79_07416 [Caballeronia hypogeia]
MLDLSLGEVSDSSSGFSRGYTSCQPLQENVTTC